MVPFIPFSPQWWAAQAAATGGQSSVSTQGPSQANFPLVSPVVDDCAPRQAFFNGVGAILNSLALQGLITRTGQDSYGSHSKLHVKDRDPTVGDDALRGYAPGHDWYNTVNGFLWKCITAGNSAAEWVGWPFTSSGTYDANLVNASPDGSAGKLSVRQFKERDMAGFTDVTTGNSSTSKHGLLPKLDGTATKYLDGSGAWSTPGGGSGGTDYSCLLSGVGTTSVTSGGGTLDLDWDTETWDTHTYHDNASNNTRISFTSATAGKYAIWFSVKLTASPGTVTVGVCPQAAVRLNGSSGVAFAAGVPEDFGLGGVAYHMQGYAEYSFVNSDYIELRLVNNTVDNLTVTEDYTLRFGVRKVDKAG